MPTEHSAALAAARWLGAHALEVFAATLCLVLIAVAAIWKLTLRYAVPSERSPLPLPAFLALHFFLGFALIVGAAMVFAELADEIDADEDLGALDQGFTAAMTAQVSSLTTDFFAVVTHLGDTVTLTALCLVAAAWLIGRGRRWLAAAWIAAVAGNAVLNSTLKHVFRRVRPVHDDPLSVVEGWSFPSGHTSGAVVTYGMLAYVMIRNAPPRWRLPIVLTATGLALIVAWSRIFIRAHFASDVLAGFASGIAWLAVCIVSVELTRYYRRTK